MNNATPARPVRVAILDDYLGIARDVADWSALEGRCEIHTFREPIALADAPRRLRDFDAVCHLRERMAMPRELIEQLPSLKFIGITGAQHRTLDLPAARERGIVVSWAPAPAEGQTATPDLAWGLILSLMRHLPQEINAMRHGGWQRTCGRGLRGKTLGLVGLGRLGRHMVPVAQAFGMEVLAWSQNLTAEAAAQAGAQRVDKAELFARSDVVSLHLVLSDRTRHVVGAAELAAMKPDAVLVNTSRGPLVDRAALIEALRNRRIGGAALDVYDVEPLPDDDELRRVEGLLLTPHLGYFTRETLAAFYTHTVENLQAWLSGQPIRLAQG